jgi:hypothetical protein
MDEDTEQGTEQKTDVKTDAPEVAKYTDKQLNDLIAKNSGKAAEKAQAELLSRYGFKDATELDELKKLRDSQMSETERLKAELEETKAKTGELTKSAQISEGRAEAVSLGVPAESAARVAKFALDCEGETIADKVKSFLAENPEFIRKPEGSAFGSKSKNETPNDQDALLALARKQAGLTK